jgi:hypothetical protein
MSSSDTSLATSVLESLGIQSTLTTSGSVLCSFSSPRNFVRRVVVVELRPSQFWITIRGYLYGNVPVSAMNAVSRYLVKLNARSRAVRYCMLQNVVLIQTEVAKSRLSRDSLGEALAAIVTSASATIHEIAAVATSSTVANLFLTICNAELQDGEVVLTPEIKSVLDELDLKPTPIERFAVNKGENRNE